MSVQEKLEQAIAQYQDAQKQLASWQERVIFLAGKIEVLQDLWNDEQLPSEQVLDSEGNVLAQSKKVSRGRPH